jgi:hypothetical protein
MSVGVIFHNTDIALRFAKRLRTFKKKAYMKYSCFDVNVSFIDAYNTISQRR